MNKLTFSKLILISTVLFQTALNSSCNEKEPAKPTNDEELITTLKLTVYNQLDSTLAGEFIFRDQDGAGGKEPSKWDTIKLKQGNYFVNTTLFNESDPLDISDITPEIKEEAEDHLFFYNHNLNGLTIENGDIFNGLPLGLNTKWKATATEKGKLTVVLKHMPGGIKAVDQSVGDTDLEVVFELEIE
jgi:hypothetical protein